MKAIRQILAAPFFTLVMLTFALTLLLDMVGNAAVFLGEMVEGEK